MSIPEALAEMRLRLATLWPLAQDRTGSPHPPGEEELPAFAVAVAPAGAAEPRAMGAAEYRVSAGATVALRVRTVPGQDVEAALHLAADQAEAAILGAPRLLGGAVWAITPGDREIQVAAGEQRISALVLGFEIVAWGPDPAATAPDFLGLA